MDNEISILMCLSGLVTPSSYVCDPFVGTGSILFTAAVMGATTVGMDIDVRVLKGRKKGVDVFSNFDKFSLPRPDIFRMDFSMHSRVLGGRGGLGGTDDAIITDPPYGIRAGARRIDGSGTTGGRRDDHIVKTKVYEVSDVMSDLLSMAAENLRMGGRLVYLIPTLRDFDEKFDLPGHECLKLEWCCNQPLQLQLGRRMVVMTKVKEFDKGKAAEWRSKCWPMGEESANKVERLREQMGKEAERKRRALEEGGGGEGNKTSKKKKRKICGVERNTVEVKKFQDDDQDDSGDK
jgi:tRNA (guanine10-N2)-methyltransferase